MSIGTRLKQLRELKGLSQNELAKRAGISQPVISDLERGVREDMTLETAQRLARALGVTLDMLAGELEGELEPAALAIA